MLPIRLSLAAAFAVAGSCHAAEFSLRQFDSLSRRSHNFGDLAAAVDLDGDGRDELAVVTYPGPVLQVLALSGGELVERQRLLLDFNGFPYITRAHGPRGPVLFVHGAHGDLLEVSGSPLSVVRSLPLRPDHLEVADVDADGDLDLLTVNGYTLEQRNYASGELEWTSPYGVGGPAFTLLQLDADAALEIVVSELPGTVIDGATHSLQFEWADSFGKLLPMTLPDGSAGLFASNIAGAFRLPTLEPVWTAGTATGRAAAVDFDGDGRDEIVSQNGFAIRADVFDVATRTRRFFIDVTNNDRNVQLLRADLDGDGRDESVHITSPFGPIVQVGTGAGPTTLRALAPRHADEAVAARGDLDGDGSEEFVTATAAQARFTELRSVDADSGDLERSGSAPVMTKLHLGAFALDGDAPLEVALGADAGAGARVSAHAGESLVEQWAVGPDVLGDFDVTAFAAGDLDADGNVELVVGLSSLPPPATSGWRLAVLDGSTGALEWMSPAFSAGIGWDPLESTCRHASLSIL